MPNTKFSYMYRDGSNYKFDGQVIFSGPFTAEQQDRLTARLGGDLFFIAHEVGIPEVAPYATGEYDANCDDHCFHTGDPFVLTDEGPTDPRTVEAFVAAVEAAPGIEFDPCDPYDSYHKRKRIPA
jgi:hypothetical protein